MSLLFIFLIALLLEGIEILIYTYIIKKNSAITVRRVVTGFVVIFIFASLIGGFYVVNKNYAYVYNDFLGKTKVVNEQGLKYRPLYLSTIEKYDLRNTIIIYPDTIPSMKLPTKDSQILQVQAAMYYKIENLTEYAINNKNTEGQIFNYLSSLIKETVSSKTKEELDNQRNKIEEEIRNKLDIFGNDKGIAVTGFKFTNILLAQELLESQAYSESTKIRSEADKKANDLLQSSLDKYTNEQLQYLRTKLIVEKSPNVRWVIPDGSSVIVSDTGGN